MNKTKLSIIIDSLFISTLSTLILSVWIKKLFKNANLFYFFLFFINLTLFIAILFSLFKINNKKIFKRNNDSFLNNCLIKLIMFDEENYHNYLCKLFSCEKINNYFFRHENNYFYINLKINLSQRDYFYAQELFLKNKNQDSKLFFIYYKKEKSFDDILFYSDINYKVFSSDLIIKLMNKEKFYPIENNKKEFISMKEKIKKYIKSKSGGFNKKHFKEILFSGISLLFLSLISPFSNYYLIIGTILIFVSIITLFKKNYTNNNFETEIFD